MTTSTSPTRQGEEAAAAFRRKHGLEDHEPIGAVGRLIELVEADFVYLDLPRDLDAFAVHDPESQCTVVGIGTTDNPFRQRLTVAHEIGHLWFEDFESQATFVCSPDLPNETRANSFARNLLCPTGAIKSSKKYLGLAQQGKLVELLSEVCRDFGVSPHVAAIQLKNAAMISEAEVAKFKGYSAAALASAFNWKYVIDQARLVSIRPQPSTKLVRDAIDGFDLGIVPLGAIALAQNSSLSEAEESVVERALGAAYKRSTSQDGERRNSADPVADLDAFFGEE